MPEICRARAQCAWMVAMRQPGFFPSFASYEVDALPSRPALPALPASPVAAPSKESAIPGQVSISQPSTGGAERRQSGQRVRARDRLMDRATRPTPESDALSQVRGLQNLVLFIDDDLRETGMALGKVEGYLVEILKLIEQPRITREDVHALAADTQVLDHVDGLVENLETLRGRLARLAASLR
jgi:hypothetical protein